MMTGGTRSGESVRTPAGKSTATGDYGPRVRRVLASRVFALVPLSRTRLVALAAVCWVVVGAIAGLHVWTTAMKPTAAGDAVAAWQPIGRADSPVGLARGWTIAMTLSIAAIGTLCYRVRSYRRDDFRGLYRVWRWVVVSALLAAAAAAMPWLALAAALLSTLTGERTLPADQTIGLIAATMLAAMAIRLAMEMREHPAAVFWTFVAGLLQALPIAGQIGSVTGRWAMLDTAAAMAAPVAATLTMLTTLSHLRRLVRTAARMGQPRSIGDRWAEAVSEWRTDRQWTRQRAKRSGSVPPTDAATEKPERGVTRSRSESVAEPKTGPPRRWFGRRPGATAANDQASDQVRQVDAESYDIAAAQPQPAAEPESAAEPEPADISEPEDASEPQDDATLSKAERRRLRKAARRGGRAA